MKYYTGKRIQLRGGMFLCKRSPTLPFMKDVEIFDFLTHEKASRMDKKSSIVKK
jgi:hypothetical protein